ncbi:MAG: DUF1489 domain-containing protein [Pseudomonadota bacterium]
MEKTGGPGPLNLVKLCVGADTIEDLAAWQAHLATTRTAAGLPPEPRHVTRQWPRRAAEILGQGEAGPGKGSGSLYWVIRGLILVRQRITALEETPGEDGIIRCGIVMDPQIVRVESRPRRVFQGWRYLTGADAPPDLGIWRADSQDDGAASAALPRELEVALDALGVGAIAR